jgi:adenylate cyclase
MLAEFASVVDALRCSVEVQRSMAERNSEVPREKRIEFRLGIHRGDIIIDGGNIFGCGNDATNPRLRPHRAQMVSASQLSV